jgi:hypothetical protein
LAISDSFVTNINHMGLPITINVAQCAHKFMLITNEY